MVIRSKRHSTYAKLSHLATKQLDVPREEKDYPDRMRGKTLF